MPTSDLAQALMPPTKQQKNEEVVKAYAAFLCSLILLVVGVCWLREVCNKVETPAQESKTPNGPRRLARWARAQIFRNLERRSKWEWFGKPSVGVIAIVTVYLVCNTTLSTTHFALLQLNHWASRFGWMSAANMALCVFFGLKNTPLSLMANTSHAQLNLYHRIVGYTAVFLMVLHAIFYTIHFGVRLGRWETLLKKEDIEGMGAGVAMLVLLLGVARHRGYEVFYISHIVGFVAAVVLTALHRPNWAKKLPLVMSLTFTMWMCDRAIRAARMLRNLVNNHVTLHPLPDGGTRLLLAKPGVEDAVPGTHCFLWIPRVHPYENHPFTIVDNGPSGLELVMKSHQGFTRAVGRFAAGHPRRRLWASVDGPYGALPSMEDYDKLVFVAGGSGAAFTFGLVNRVLRQCDGSKLKPVEFAWTVKRKEHLAWFQNHLQRLRRASPTAAIRLHITDEKSKTDSDTAPTAAPESQHHRNTPTTGLLSEAGTLNYETVSELGNAESLLSEASLCIDEQLFDLRYERMDVQEVVADAMRTVEDHDRVLIATCGPESLMDAQYDEGRARELIPALNTHLEDLRRLLAQSKSLARDVQFQVTPRNQRTNKALLVNSVDLAPVNQVREQFRENVDGFWAVSGSGGHANAELRRRVACVVVFLRSKLDAQASVPPQVAGIFSGQHNYTDVRNAGRKYIQIARKLGGLGSILWLPLDIPPSTYERYLNIDDEDVFSHLQSLAPRFEDYTVFVQRLILNPSLSSSYYNLIVDYADILPASDQLLLLVYALGGSSIPEDLLKFVRLPQRRWNSEGEIESTNATAFGLPPELTSLLSDDIELSLATENPYIMKHTLNDDVSALSLSPEFAASLSRALLPKAVDELGATALKFMCFICPPCYEGNTDWSPTLKETVWNTMDRAITTYKVQSSLRTQVIDAILYYAERDSVAMRRVAVEKAKTFLRKSMPYQYHASVVLFRSNIYRIDGEFAKSEALIRDFVWRGPHPSTRFDHALLGRLHISQVENKIKCYDNDVSSFIYKWQAEQPLSTLDIEVTFRLQSTAARYFHSIGDFDATRDSLEQSLSLDNTKPIRRNTRRLLVGRLADIYCNMREYSKAVDLLRPELDETTDAERPRRGFRRLLLASLEASIGLMRLDDAEAAVKELAGYEPAAIDNLHDQQLHMRLLVAAARIAHLDPGRRGGAVALWERALEDVQRMHTIGSGGGFTAALIYLSLAHARLAAGDRDGARRAWATGAEILRTESCEFWLPTVPNVWLQSIARDVHETQGWTFRMMQPGGRPDVTTP
ncbi:hypothetical protein CkaCkLH20_05623 [Colletotrichum karsti]|uniref:FAD-binding FR-type domain-containing protein n=1 Tax=Colletotrichum karsti TaxID=1095194 RepID=A0A9P6I4G9_9PEZI|nr:uncharacterized protein CkaCkLH20_05623 [Colletotrichum karsti]KAF9876777.1 hypothetical protein CkaCkLH20_05623 [Colletotrichum karsti]